MLLLIKIFTRYRFLVFFLFLQGVALGLVFSRNAMQESWLAAQTANLSGLISGYVSEGTSYLSLKKENEVLMRQNKALMSQLYGHQRQTMPAFRRVSDTLGGGQVYTFVDGEVLNNSVHRRDNYFIINRGMRHGVYPKMAVIAPNGIAGIVINAMPNYSLVQSVLSTSKIRVSASLKKSGYFGTLTWDGKDARTMTLSEVPKYVSLKVGDTVVTDGKSAIFPQGVMIGRVAGYSVDTQTGFWSISVQLSEELAKMKKIFVVRNLKKLEVKQVQDTLKASIENGQ